jgi:hypothetical protein
MTFLRRLGCKARRVSGVKVRAIPQTTLSRLSKRQYSNAGRPPIQKERAKIAQKGQKFGHTANCYLFLRKRIISEFLAPLACLESFVERLSNTKRWSDATSSYLDYRLQVVNRRVTPFEMDACIIEGLL